MKATLEFDLDDPQDRLSHKRAVSGTDAYIALHDIHILLREYSKYDKNISAGTKMALPEGYHTITEHESIILHELIHGLSLQINNVLIDRGIKLEDLE